ncbi:ComEC/Rec2 family competence protein [Ammoniphilus sp. 3BR4]|uniref:ComEC/Rec2 family competence protein n=1 Tax=Ammoniphilus sp. 3BR4 TaxID=3158265 RepID=UPI003464EEB0
MLRFLLQSIFFSVLLTVLTLYLLLHYLHLTSAGTRNNLEGTAEQTINLHEQDMVLHFINLKIGKTTMIQIGERAILIDAGHEQDSDELRDYLQKHGITQVSDILLSNPGVENTGGIKSLLKHHPAAKIYVPALTKDQYTLDPSIILLTLRAGDRLVLSEEKKIDLEVLSPLRPLYSDHANNSMVNLLRYQDLRVLLTNDIREDAETRLIEQHPLLRAHIMTVPDRPSGVQNSQKLIERLNPQTAVMLEMPCTECKEAAQKAAREYAHEWSDFFFVPIGENILISFHDGMYVTPKEQTK